MCDDMTINERTVRKGGGGGGVRALQDHFNIRLAPMWQQSGTLLFCSCHGIAGFLVDELQI